MTTCITDIFEYLRNILHCEYISDLQLNNNRLLAIAELKKIDITIIDPKQYQDICQYLRKTI